MAADPLPHHTCWKCHRTYPDSVKICVSCGVDLQTGDDLARKNQPSFDSDEVDPYRARNTLEWVTISLPGLFQPNILLCFLAMSGIFVTLGVLTMLLLSHNVFLTAMFVGAAALLAWSQGIVWLLLGRIALLHEGLTEIRRSQWNLFLLLTVAPAAVFVVVLRSQMPVEGM